MQLAPHGPQAWYMAMPGFPFRLRRAVQVLALALSLRLCGPARGIWPRAVAHRDRLCTARGHTYCAGELHKDREQTLAQWSSGWLEIRNRLRKNGKVSMTSHTRESPMLLTKELQTSLEGKWGERAQEWQQVRHL